VDQPAAGAAGEQRIARPARRGGLGAVPRPRSVEPRARGREDAGADRRAGIGERQRDLAFAIGDGDDVPRGDLGRDRRDGAIVDPGVAGDDPFAQRLGQVERGAGAGAGRQRWHPCVLVPRAARARHASFTSAARR
jgi:hypothetical protein